MNLRLFRLDRAVTILALTATFCVSAHADLKKHDWKQLDNAFEKKCGDVDNETLYGYLEAVQNPAAAYMPPDAKFSEAWLMMLQIQATRRIDKASDCKEAVGIFSKYLAIGSAAEEMEMELTQKIVGRDRDLGIGNGPAHRRYHSCLITGKPDGKIESYAYEKQQQILIAGVEKTNGKLVVSDQVLQTFMGNVWTNLINQTRPRDCADMKKIDETLILILAKVDLAFRQVVINAGYKGI